MQDALNNLQAGGAEVIDVNERRVVTGIPITRRTKAWPSMEQWWFRRGGSLSSAT